MGIRLLPGAHTWLGTMITDHDPCLCLLCNSPMHTEDFRSIFRNHAKVFSVEAGPSIVLRQARVRVSELRGDATVAEEQHQAPGLVIDGNGHHQLLVPGK